MSVEQHESMLEDLAEDYHRILVTDGWPKNDWRTWKMAREKARSAWEGQVLYGGHGRDE